jgi:hypothetical protein
MTIKPASTWTVNSTAIMRLPRRSLVSCLRIMLYFRFLYLIVNSVLTG